MQQYRNRPEHLCSLENDELIAICDKWIDKLIKSGGKDWVMNVPARPNSDPDLVLTELVERFKKMQEPVSAPSAQRGEFTGLEIGTIAYDAEADDLRITPNKTAAPSTPIESEPLQVLRANILLHLNAEQKQSLYAWLKDYLPAAPVQSAGMQWVKCSVKKPDTSDAVCRKIGYVDVLSRDDYNAQVDCGYIDPAEWEWLDEWSSPSTVKEQGFSREALRKEIWAMLTDECKKIMEPLKESYLESIMADIDAYKGVGKEQETAIAHLKSEIERRTKMIEDDLKRQMRLNMPGISFQEQEKSWMRYKELNNL